MNEKKMNEKSFPEVYYARHMQEGVVNYPETNEVNLITNNTLTEMAKTFEGKPVFVGHQDVDLANLKVQADGYVTCCFYNKYDGWWWLKFIAVSDTAKDAIKQGWKVSNCYEKFVRGAGGTWHGVEYDSELLGNEIGYEHLAIVENPRYEGAIILTEEAYDNYIKELQQKLDKKINSKTEEKPMWKLFQKKINEVEVEDIYVDLGGGGHMLLKEALDKFEELRNADAEAEAKANRKIANADDEVSLHDGSKVKISEIIDRINKCNEAEKEEEKENEEPVDEEEEKAPPASEEKENEADEEAKENESAEEEKEEDKENEADEEKEEDKENEAEEDEEEKENKKKNSSELRQAYMNSGLDVKLEDNEDFKHGKELLNGYEKAKQMGI
jgi:hypothetical protein